jgi:trehalose monomycolate/heme transporter
MNIDYDGGSQSKQTQNLVKRIRQVPAPERFEAKVGGETATLVDLLAALREYIPYALAVIVGTLFILLMIMLRSLLIPLKAIVMNILTLSAAFGA